ncbi:hypothetical protein [Flavobacterium sp. MK4S-17]|uniref:hypothetical protein n=1 Tax=Flavobacterium sp. MK4S-17 TaxID=2543737 RepID=UPI00135B9785|nr:hypothetical protein [Flavobacterium sp. MK4S-17]
MNFVHILLKPTKIIKTNFNISEVTSKIEIPKKSKDFVKEYLTSNKLSDEYGSDLMLAFEDEFIYGFDYNYNNQKLLIPEINPVTIFYSNALMSHHNLIAFRKALYSESPTITDYKKTVNPSLFGNFFQLASNCIINLQAAIETFTNRLIPENYTYLDKDGNNFNPSLFHKLDSTLPEITDKKFRTKYKKDNFLIKKIIELRNEIIHLKPIQEKTNTQYKIIYRKILNFEYNKAIIATRNFINYYEPNLIEECSCGKEHYYEITIDNSKQNT